MTLEQLRVRCDCSPVHETTYEPTSDASITRAVVDAIAAAADADPTDLRPLHESIDPDALERLFEDRTDTNRVVLGFAVEEWNVFVGGDGSIRVCDPSDQGDATPLFGKTTTASTD